MADRPRMRVVATVLASENPRQLAVFYECLLGWQRITDKPNWVTVRPIDGGAGLSFQRELYYKPPVWPSEPDAPQTMMHLDIAVDDLDKAEAWALEAGAVVADFQPQERVRVMLDPAGHPFCLFLPSQ